MLSASFEGFCQSLRILLEAVWRSNDLILVDPHEAAGNIELGFTNLLNSFHSLYDISKRNGIELDWYGIPEIATILAIRNARHHNIANRIRGLYTYQLQKDHPAEFTPYLILDYPETKDGGTTFQTLISWGDFDEMLSMPTSATKLRASVPPAIRNYLNSDGINTQAIKSNLDKHSVFLNATPLIVNAGIKFIPAIKDLITPKSIEAKHFITHFQNIEPADTQQHVIHKISIFLPV